MIPQAHSVWNSRVTRVGSGVLQMTPPATPESVETLSQQTSTGSSDAGDGFQVTVFIQDVRDQRLRLTSAIPVTVERWAGSVTAYNADLEDFGYGDSEAEAIGAFCDSLVDLYFILKEEGEENLGPLPLRQWRHLQRIIEEV